MKHGGIYRITPHMPGAAKGDLDEMGMKAFDLARMARIGLPVPPAFFLGTSHCRNWYRVDAVRRLTAAEGGAVVLVREEMSTADIAAMALSAGLLTARGSRTSHAAVVARQLGKPCVNACGALRIDLARRIAVFGDRFLSEGEKITLDSNSGHVYAGTAEIFVERPTTWLEEIRKWAGNREGQ